MYYAHESAQEDRNPQICVCLGIGVHVHTAVTTVAGGTLHVSLIVSSIILYVCWSISACAGSPF